VHYDEEQQHLLSAISFAASKSIDFVFLLFITDEGIAVHVFLIFANLYLLCAILAPRGIERVCPSPTKGFAIVRDILFALGSVTVLV